VNFCPVKRFGLGEHNSVRGFNLRYGPTASEFEIPSFKFHIDMVGELNVRNALAVVAAAKHCGLKNQQIQDAFSTFRGIKRRMEMKGIAGGVTIVDDFGHHPTAIRETLKALRLKFPTEKIWAVFEPRSNTTRRNVFQLELVEALLGADAVIVAEVAKLEQVPADQRLDPAQLMQDLKESGKPAEYLPTVDAIVDHVKKQARGGDVVCVFSNGGFGGIHQKLLNALQLRR
jgi:UDP-N-acetylmuramate: L-alanyl-gamma-D-glutamyl-meso-diaminopimelate ligase